MGEVDFRPSRTTWRKAAQVLPVLGHVRARCPSADDSSLACLNCGEAGHTVSDCVSEPRCNACVERRLPAGHRASNAACPLWAPTREYMRHLKEQMLQRRPSGDTRAWREEEDSLDIYRDCPSPSNQVEVWETTPEGRRERKKRKIEERAGKTASHPRVTAALDEAMEAEAEGSEGMAEVR